MLKNRFVMWVKKKLINQSFSKTDLIILSFALTIIFSSFILINKSDESAEAIAKVKAIFIYNFAKYIEWPTSGKEGDFIIGIFGEYAALVKVLNGLALTSKIGLQQMKIENYYTVNEIKECHVLFVAVDKSHLLKNILEKIKGNNTLLITDKTGLAKQGAGISLFAAEKRQQFEINRANIEKYNLMVSAKLIQLADVAY